MQTIGRLTFGSILILLAMAAGAVEIEVPANQSGLDVTPLGKAATFRMRIEYGTFALTRSHSESPGTLVLPIPSSSEIQTVRVLTTEGFDISSVSRDRFGNCILISEPLDRSGLPAFVSVDLEIVSLRPKFTIPRTHYYEVAVDPWVAGALLDDPDLQSIERHVRVPVAPDPSFAGVMNAVSAYKAAIDSLTSPPLYDEAMRPLSPVTRVDFLERAQQFCALLADRGISSRICWGWNFPPGVDTYREDFLVEVLLPGRGAVILDRYLKLFSDYDCFVQSFYGFDPENRLDGAAYVGFVSGGGSGVTVEFPHTGVYVSCGLAETDQAAGRSRFDELVYTIITRERTGVSPDEWIGPAHQLGEAAFRTIRKTRDEKRFFDDPVGYRVRDLVLSAGLDGNYDPVDITAVFEAGYRIYATVYFEGTGYEKQVIVRWKTPTGDIFHTTEDDVNANWTSYFGSIRTNADMERGIWIIEVQVNGALEHRESFELR
jgi:hypothetical protein